MGKNTLSLKDHPAISPKFIHDMRKLTLHFTLFLLIIAAPQLYAQTDTVPPIGGIVLDEDTYATLGEP